MAFMEFSSELTRSDRAAQCLEKKERERERDSLVCSSCSRLTSKLRPRLPGHLENPEQSDAAQHGDADGRYELQLHQQRFQDAAAHHEAIEAVEQRHEIDLQAEGVHLHQHLQSEQQQQDLVGSL